MKATCPLCGCYSPLEIFLTADDAKSVQLAVAALPGELPRLTWSYLGLWRKPGSSRVLTWERAGRIVTELAELVAEPEIQWKGGRLVPSRPEFWAQAIKLILDRDAQGKLDRPLEAHNYLRAVTYELAEKAWHQGNVRREEEAKRRPPEAPQIRRELKHENNHVVPLAEGIKGWREKLGLSKSEGGSTE